jgi:hypothetical protein
VCTERNDAEISAVHAIIHVTSRMYTYKLFRAVVLIKVVYVETLTFHPSSLPSLVCGHMLCSHLNKHSLSPNIPFQFPELMSNYGELKSSVTV